MKPYKSYLSLQKSGGKLNKVLIVVLIFQIIILCLLKTTITIPVAFAKRLSEDYETNGVVFNYENIVFTFPNQFKVGRFTLSKDDHPVIGINGLSFQCSIFDLPWGKLNDLENFQTEEIFFYSPLKERPVLSITNARIRKNENNQYFTTSSISLDQKILDVRGILDFNYIKSLLPEKESGTSEETIDRLIAAVEKLDSWVDGTPPIQLQAFVNAIPNATLCISQSSEPDKEMSGFSKQTNGFCSFLKISAEGDKTHSVSLKARIDAFSHKIKSLGLTLEDITLTNSSIKFENLSNLKNDWGESSLSVGKIRLDGKMQGHLPRFNVISKSSEKLTEGMFFSDSNRTRMSLSYQYKSFLTLNGEVQLIPKNFDLYCDTKNGRLKVFDGDEIHAYVFRNKKENRASIPMFFRARSDRLSIFETPDGAFTLSGQIAPDYSIFVDSAWGKLGSSEITGTYSQSWHPHNFRFLLKGECLPTDINNWLGKWWKTIWDEFAFTDEIPHGDFSISGNWQNPRTSTITHGTAETGSFSYRDLSTNESILMVYADGNNTQIKASANHDKGHLYGNLTIPRNLGSADNPLSFQLKGDFPLNEGKKVFGREVEEILSDFNSSVVSCEADGSIYLSRTDHSAEDNKTYYTIAISTDNNASLWNIPVSHIHGTIKHNDGTTRGIFPSIGMGKGKSSLDFESNSFPSGDSLSFRFHLKGADRSAISSTISNFSFLDSSDRDHIKKTFKAAKTSAGTLDLSVQAKGPLQNYMQFKGTGHFRLVEKSLSRVNIFGEISKKLNTLKLPIPSGSFSFERLEIPFRIEYDNIHSDNILLTGPLSKLEASGKLNLVSNEVDLTAKLKLAGNLKIPLISQVINFADPLSKITEIKISGNWKDPKTELIINPFK